MWVYTPFVAQMPQIISGSSINRLRIVLTNLRLHNSNLFLLFQISFFIEYYILATHQWLVTVLSFSLFLLH